MGLEDEAGLLGLIGLRPLSPGQAEITHMAVQPGTQRRGMGRQLLALAAAQGWTDLSAETDAQAVDFYRACGFAITSLGERYPGTERFLCRWTQP
ncbi:GNAT family N-acetyltransferase [Deinococcus radiophilus]|uniref:GNAT family N-acetyltransferase n=1 Tax=Deinococcus radiophilus TaxID=32062 RepID=UPI0036234339